ncbi:IS1 family transposase [Roseivirga sp.]|uniref:IS1 family transposase n=1 Tax=Roseivirga sp. TaxID=1964215 RepID=UPI003B5172C5
MKCQYCASPCIKAGKQSNGKQKYCCKICRKYQQSTYRYLACNYSSKQLYLNCLKTGSGLRGSQVITGVAVSTQLRWIRKWGKTLVPQTAFLPNDEYEIDELCTYVGHKKNRKWVISAISRGTGKIIDVVVGSRSLRNLGQVVQKVLALSPKAIYTDRLRQYFCLIPSHLHHVRRRGINKIERHHLNLRLHIKRLNRKTICFSKKLIVLLALVKIYVWFQVIPFI